MKTGMTPKEHMLMLLVFVRQRQAIRVLLDMLRSRRILTDDEQAFGFSQMQDAASTAASFAEGRENYLVLAHSLGVRTGLEDIGDLPEEWFRAKS